MKTFNKVILLILILTSQVSFAKTSVEFEIFEPFKRVVGSIFNDMFNNDNYTKTTPIQLRVGHDFEKFNVSYSFISRTIDDIDSNIKSSVGYVIDDDSGKFRAHVFRLAYNVYGGIYIGAGIGHYSYDATLVVSDGSSTSKESLNKSLINGEFFINYSYDFYEGFYLKGEFDYLLGAGSTSITRSAYSYDSGHVGRGTNILFLLGYKF